MIARKNLIALLVLGFSPYYVSHLDAQALGQTQTDTAQSDTPVPSQSQLVDASKLPSMFSGFLQKIGGRLISLDKAQVVLTGTTTDGSGARPAQITLQAPGLFSYREGQTRALTFDGTNFQSKSGQITSDDERVLESLLADFPDSVCMQVAAGGSLRQIGSHYRTDDGSTPNYSGPYWTLLAFGPKQRPALAAGKALQQSIFIAIDEQTGFLSEIRTVVNVGKDLHNVTQTQFTNWTQQGGQWFPGQIIRLENGSQVLSFQAQQLSVGSAAASTAFLP